MIVYTALAKVVLRSDPPSINLAAEEKGRPEPLSSKATFGGIAWEGSPTGCHLGWEGLIRQNWQSIDPAWPLFCGFF